MCTHIIWLTKKRLTYYTGNYDTFRKTVRENEVIQMKKYEKEQDDIKHLKEFIASCGTYANLVKQARHRWLTITPAAALGSVQSLFALSAKCRDSERRCR